MKTKSVLLLLASALAISSPLFAENVYVSQSGAGDGSSCTSSRSASWFNSSANWANPKQTGKIGPGDTVFLCGTVTTSLALQNSGSTGSYVTIDGTASTLGTGFGFSTNNKSWWVIQNATWADGATNTIVNIAGGSNGIVTGIH